MNYGYMDTAQLMPKTSSISANPIGITAVLWGLSGFFYIMSNALIHLAARSMEAFQYTLSPLQWALLIVNIVFMAYSEGYKGFQKNYAPRLAARAKYLSCTRRPLELIFAPLFCMNFFNAPKRRILISILMVIAIVILVVLFRMLPQPWRGILDAGVVVGLLWGTLACLWFCYRAFTDSEFDANPEVLTNH